MTEAQTNAEFYRQLDSVQHIVRALDATLASSGLPDALCDMALMDALARRIACGYEFDPEGRTNRVSHATRIVTGLVARRAFDKITLGGSSR